LPADISAPTTPQTCCHPIAQLVFNTTSRDDHPKRGLQGDRVPDAELAADAARCGMLRLTLRLLSGRHGMQSDARAMGQPFGGVMAPGGLDSFG
jgi:hypothetical protein